MADGSFPGLISRDRNVNSQTNSIWVRLTDDTNATTTGGGVEAAALRVTIASDSTGVLSVDDNGGSLTVDGTVAATQSGTWNIGTVTTLTGITNDVNIADGGNVISIDDGGGSITVDGSVTTTVASDAVDDTAFTIATDSVSVNGFLADETTPDSVDEGDVGAARMTLDRKQLVVLVDPTTDAQRLVIDASGYVTTNINGTVTVSATNLDIRDLTHVSDSVQIGDGTDTLAVNSDGSINVNVVSSVITGEVHDYDTAAAVASDSTSNHDYATVNTTFLLKSVLVSGSGSVKFEIQTGPVASLATVAVGFLTGRQGDTKQVTFDPPIEIPATSTGTTRVIRTNRQGAATDVYSTIIGLDV